MSAHLCELVYICPAPAHEVKDMCKWFPEGSSGGPPCFNNQHKCETTTGVPCHSK